MILIESVKYLESDLIQQIESNDAGFTGIWSPSKKLECGTLFLNSQLSNDVFFNKLSAVTCINEKMIEQLSEQVRKNRTNLFVHSLNYPEFEKLLKAKGFIYHDTQYVLKKTSLTPKKSSAVKISSDTISVWTKIFCEAYDCPEWFESVSLIVQKSLSVIDYFVDESMSSCVALYQANSILGLYCLGTIPSRRKQGTASSLIDFATNEVQSRNLDFLMLETYGKDKLLKFYSKLGFETLYFKNVYSI